MPESSRIYARMRPSLADALAAHPVLRGEVYRFGTDELTFAPHPRGLLVANVPDALWSGPSLDVSEEERARVGDPLLWPANDESPTPLEILLADVRVCGRFLWLPQVAPPVHVLRWLRALSREHRVPIAWYHVLERGDDLYYDLAVVFDGERQEGFAGATFLGAERPGNVHVVDGVVDHTASFEWVLSQVWKALGAPIGPAYFPPDDTANYDWDRHRIG
jgi:hypothetical protein